MEYLKLAPEALTQIMQIVSTIATKPLVQFGP